jgi:dimethylhistidine N-methyltransferase
MTTSTTNRAFTVDVHLDAAELDAELRRDAGAGLTARPRHLSPTWLYDERGCALFEAITELPEYYPTRTERSILASHAEEIARLSAADTLVELGSGTSEKTRLLLDALTATGQLERFVPFDVAEATLRSAAESIADAYPGVDVRAVVGDFRRHLPMIPTRGRRLFAFLGGTIGNFTPDDRRRFLAALAGSMVPGDSLLLGTDLVKDPARLVAAYDDAAGITAEFDRNVLAVLNQRLGANFAPDRFTHVAVWNAGEEWIEMRLRAQGDQMVTVPALDLTLDIGDGDELRTEISAKFRRRGVRRELRAAGLRPCAWWTDPCGDFALSLAVR